MTARHPTLNQLNRAGCTGFPGVRAGERQRARQHEQELMARTLERCDAPLRVKSRAHRQSRLLSGGTVDRPAHEVGMTIVPGVFLMQLDEV